MHVWQRFNPLPYKEISDLSKFKADADNNINLTQNLKFVLVTFFGKGENAAYKNFSPFSYNIFKSLFSQVLKTWDYL